MTILHKECLATELALPANLAIITGAAVSEVATGAGAPSGAPATGVKLYVDTTSKSIYYWNGTVWSQTSAGAVVASGVPSGAPTNGNSLYVDSATGIAYYWNGTVWTALASGGTAEVTSGSGVPVAAPATGIIIYIDTATAQQYYWNGTIWTLIVAPPSEPLFMYFTYR
jgi:hypothetical protein